MTINHETKLQQLPEGHRLDSSAASLERLAADRKKQSKRLSKQLTRGKTGRLGPLESLTMKLAGRLDGKAGLPQPTADGAWTSPRINRELNAYEEFCDRAWGDQQIRLQWVHERCDCLIDDVLRLEEKVAHARAEVKTAPAPQTVRQRGEEELSDDQVQARRNREAAREKASRQAAVNRLRAALQEKYEELSLLHSHELETGNATRLICQRVMDHVRQRLYLYWHSAYRVHPERERMPVYAPSLPQPEAEEIYYQQHGGREETVAALLERYRTQQKDEESTVKEVA